MESSQSLTSACVDQDEIDKYISQIKKIMNHSISPDNWKQIINKMSNQSFKSLAQYVVNMQEIFYQNNFTSAITTNIPESIDKFSPSSIENPEARLVFVKNGLENIDRVLSSLEKIDYSRNLTIEERLLQLHQRIAEMPPLTKVEQTDMSNITATIQKETQKFQHDTQ